MNGRYDTTCSKARLILNKSPKVKRLESSMFLWTVQYLYYYFVMFLLMKNSSSLQVPKSNGRVHMIKTPKHHQKLANHGTISNKRPVKSQIKISHRTTGTMNNIRIPISYNSQLRK